MYKNQKLKQQAVQINCPRIIMTSFGSWVLDLEYYCAFQVQHSVEQNTVKSRFHNLVKINNIPTSQIEIVLSKFSISKAKIIRK